MLIQHLMAVLVGQTPAGSAKWKPSKPTLTYVAPAVKRITFFLLYGGIIVVIVSVCTMTPETVNDRGFLPLVGDGKSPGGDVPVLGCSLRN